MHASLLSLLSNTVTPVISIPLSPIGVARMHGMKANAHRQLVLSAQDNYITVYFAG